MSYDSEYVKIGHGVRIKSTRNMFARGCAAWFSLVRNHSMNCNWAMNFLFLYDDAASFFGSCSKSMRIAQQETTNLEQAIERYCFFVRILLFASEHTMFCDCAQLWHKSAPCNWSSRCRICEKLVAARRSVVVVQRRIHWSLLLRCSVVICAHFPMRLVHTNIYIHTIQWKAGALIWIFQI